MGSAEKDIWEICLAPVKQVFPLGGLLSDLNK